MTYFDDPAHQLSEQKEETASSRPFPITTVREFLPAMMGEEDLQTLAWLSSTCKIFQGMFQNKVNLKRDALLNQLLTHVIRGEQTEADELLNKYPGLLRLQGQATGYLGEPYEGTAFRLALGADDVKMTQMIMKHFLLLPGGDEEMRTQIAVQFPENEKKTWIARQAEDWMALKAVTLALLKATSEDDCRDAIQKFHAYMDLAYGGRGGIKRTGKHFNSDLLIQAFMIVDGKRIFEKVEGWGGWRTGTFLYKVLGYIQKHFTACLAQAFSQEQIWKIVREGEQLRRSLVLPFTSLSFFSNDRLGNDDVYYGGLDRGCWNHLIAYVTKNQRAIACICETLTVPAEYDSGISQSAMYDMINAYEESMAKLDPMFGFSPLEQMIRELAVQLDENEQTQSNETADLFPNRLVL